MDRVEATRIADEALWALRNVSPTELVTRYLDKPETSEVTGSSGATYHTETQVFWDDQEHRNLRVMVSIDDGTWRSSHVPLSRDFIVAPDGTFVGE